MGIDGSTLSGVYSGLKGGESMEMTLKAARVNAGYTQRTLSKMLGISRDKYRAIELHPGRATVDMAKEISKLVGVPYDNLFFAEEST